MTRLTFKEYLDSKKQLLMAINEHPIQTVTYDVVSYCKLIVGEKVDKYQVSLKPKQSIIVEWEYENVHTAPKPISIRFENVRDVDEYEEFVTYWSGDKFKSWLNKNTKTQ
jgi:hypothetical protein